MKKYLKKISLLLFVGILIILCNSSNVNAANETENEKSNGRVGFYLEKSGSSDSESVESKANDTNRVAPKSSEKTSGKKQLPQTGELIQLSLIGIGIGVLTFCILLYLIKLVKHLMFDYRKN
ncbi:LPXTG cell wall anchor domain-containing protein [Enterococcus malodoratus]|uniref:LPXTG-domain-containing protein cell wall anchor domain n=1 Tax=Enterococcus malodoratus ATCC 43197 TaxID=1158601 RepID=R2RY50_9ENTE|nr:LPXTG cell wall anchor domain-containing protein [Enterococcus malodoratus]EOH80839.1 LPXTG-domain-containing protein cell wall anchor domain [Enterococcus malodoratus ATCC 43197]EOT69348.1 hypothetical protein I585_00811 [Enterococcus malodoratus ATCC 43197]SPW68699.1 Uncharacterised protein [Enterococcus malodoratus]STC71298.1 Uncharacterised protein [Enterococcus malodoratus]